MATEIRVPTLGESVTEATIGKWFKKVGDAVAIDEPLVELETDKVTVEVPAAAAGVLAEIVAKEGDTVEVNALLGQISGEGAAAAPAPKKEEAKPAAAAAPAAAAPVASASSGPAMQPAPAASKLLAESGLSADQVDGSGKRGQVLKGDVLDAIAKGVSAAPAAAPVAARPASSADDASREERVKMTRLRQTIAKRLKDAQNTAAMLTTYNEVDMSAVMELRTKYKDVFEKKHGVKLGFMGFFTKAVTHALKEIPAVNAEIDGTDIIYKNFAHVGMAVGTDKGLVVPVIRDADQLSIAGVEKELGRLAKAARDGTLSMADMQGGTFTITNGGVYGSLMSSPILNSPQSGILGMHKIQDRPVVVGGQIVIRPMMYLALSYDHRIVDGKEAVTFLVRVKESLEDPERLVLDL
ncbi:MULTISPECIES: 2-oxoglutarate dehydrogenase complex dihydrolipoyllysine-residue succinyltransferase [Brucella/Ochrobactrum group]|uniref:Dihydrolipoyllysine-residue succinyltransferase component of 2-oxoglutarate dehydrogenase complex n=3 Tax=Brucella/Ochrobactrum group TaxID=2826938 RepID=A0A2P9HR43_9HYPH|nr:MULTISPECIES: 2-oxoglutarate dehydrogenase complex dihydrolipoyllysine-residue succinyltransferase [Brucella]MCI0998486.1 2-oxoglutarate dehydrogenase complex dihydrolipoyllysine-residue succinyltransferase [Ochrobactrum sp. C6C9]RRD27567.1 2-oxoglutarate dehydrogenase complex dihydrolipoyllysine-residue succinyltransferase [Brucellaceae bacterium VT-16-1752]WHT41584.1 2-oxoglutarate dehydrogenase complex dihydrolipoyllysine-residue succinyltransferase [Ochrobactrum sp. SSR]NNU59315.1 2-oxog